MLASSLAPSSPAAASPVAEVLTFDLGAERYALSLEEVQEIRGYEVPTKLPGAAPHALGIISLRGDAIPLLDMRVLMGCTAADMTPTTSVVVVRTNGRVAGFVVDAVCDVAELSEGQLRAAPRLGDAMLAHAVLGLANIGERMVIVLSAGPFLGLAGAKA